MYDSEGMQAPESKFYALSLTGWCLLVFLLTFAAFRSINLARADLDSRRNTFASLNHAVTLDPQNAVYHELLAEHTEERGNNPEPEFATAAALSPRDPRFLIRLALRQEVEGRFPEAEQTLLHALEIDKRLDTPWALMNYYFRRGNAQEFWRSASQSLERSYGDRSAIFRLCWAMSDDQQLILKVIPRRHDILLSYLQFLLATGRQDIAAPIATAAAREAIPPDLPTLLDYADKALISDPNSALSVWNDLCRRKLLPFLTLDPQRGAVVTNGDFAITPTQRGFDWRTAPAEGVSIIPAGLAHGISITMTGKEPEDFILMSQMIPLSPGLEYQLAAEYRVADSGTAPGITWEISSPESGNSEIMARSNDNNEVAGGVEWKTASLRFAAGARHSARLSLHYHRALGTVRWEGTFVIRKVVIRNAAIGLIQ